MKRSIILFFTVIFVINLHSKEGMWLPSLLSANEAEMKALGMKMSIDDIYSTNHASIKDAIVQFNGGCTASFISGDGLLLTNHHCGYSSIQSHSSVDHDYLTVWVFGKEPSGRIAKRRLYSYDGCTHGRRYRTGDEGD